MRRTFTYGCWMVVSVAALAGCTAVDRGDVDRTESALSAIPHYPHKAICADDHIPGHMHCMAHVRTDAAGKPMAAAAPQGFVPSDLVSAYNLPTTGGAGQTIAIIDAQDNPNAESDLAKYRSQFGLPACTTANGCFKKVGQDGSAKLPSPDSGWAGEIALDLDMASAVCPNCKILLVEATSATQDNLGTALNTAIAMGATVASNSYGGGEDSTVSSTDAQYFNHPGVAITVSSGDNGYGAQYPASSQYVIAVGGTSLAASSSTSRGWVEGVWGDASNSQGGAGSGCSADITKPSWQKDTGCKKRMIADVSAVADPNTGVAVYDTYGGAAAGATGWIVVGGTSASAPIVAATLALTGHNKDSAAFIYANTGNWYDVTSGTNGSCGANAYYCKAAAGYDGPTGWGTPNGQALGGTQSGTTGGTTGTSTTGGTTGGTTGTSTTGGTTGKGTTTGGTTGTSTTGGTTGGTTGTSTTGGTTGKGTTTGGTTGSSTTGGTTGKGTTTGGTTGSSTTGGTTGSSTTGGTTGSGGSCAHDVCSSGKKLKASCSTCATIVCDYGDYYYYPDSYCCNNRWDSICVSEAAEECGECN